MFASNLNIFFASNLTIFFSNLNLTLYFNLVHFSTLGFNLTQLKFFIFNLSRVAFSTDYLAFELLHALRCVAIMPYGVKVDFGTACRKVPVFRFGMLKIG